MILISTFVSEVTPFQPLPMVSPVVGILLTIISFAEPIHPISIQNRLRKWLVVLILQYARADLLYVQQFLGHKSLSNTLKYIQLSNACFYENTDHYICKVAGTVQDATELVELGFDYVTDVDGIKLFRKPA